jgi:carbon-monoxide dehydrogenase medium subunit
MREFLYLQPDTLEEAISLLNEYGDDAKLMAGGQSIVLLMREGLVQPDVLVDLTKIKGLDTIQADASETAVEIGALATHRQVERSPVICQSFPVVPGAYQMLASVPVRNLGTLGGNLAHNAPGSDPPPLLIALDATVTMQGQGGERTLDVEEFGTGYFETALQSGEVLTKVRVPRMPPGSGLAYRKYAVRPMDMAIVGVAARVTLAEGACCEIRIALSGVSASTMRARRAEAALEGQLFDESAMAAAAAIAAEESDPLSDVHASAEYRRQLTVPAVRRALTQAWQQALAS